MPQCRATSARAGHTGAFGERSIGRPSGRPSRRSRVNTDTPVSTTILLPGHRAGHGGVAGARPGVRRDRRTAAAATRSILAQRLRQNRSRRTDHHHCRAPRDRARRPHVAANARGRRAGCRLGHDPRRAGRGRESSCLRQPTRGRRRGVAPGWDPLRRAGAVARTMLVAAAASQCGRSIRRRAQRPAVRCTIRRPDDISRTDRS